MEDMGNIENIEDYFDIKFRLINVFLLEMHENILDISYAYDKDTLNLQIVLLEGTVLAKCYDKSLRDTFNEYDVKIDMIFLTKEIFNQNKGGWLPSGYKWLEFVLYSKAEIL